MARKSLIAREAKRRKLVEKYAKIREELKEQGDYEALQNYLKTLLRLDYITDVQWPADQDHTIESLVYQGWFLEKWL